ncbi:MAG TPA: hypothetical protein VHM02_11050 [Thermoanaerobaculia bacterium]|nr:hypothetical protein [Thermoanaerobaculia bacterium]
MPGSLRRLLARSRPAEPAPPPRPPWLADGRPLRLHVGAGRERLEGWVNLDLLDLPGVDVVADVTQGLDFTGVEAVYAEHFLEHLRADQGIDFLAECHRCMAPGGLLRLSTPNLDWVWLTHYHPDAPAEVKEREALLTNRAFHGWGHRFLWNRELLAAALDACGFERLAWCAWGESEHALFQGIERHERYGDDPAIPHVLIVDAVRGDERPEALAALRRRFAEELVQHLDA